MVEVCEEDCADSVSIQDYSLLVKIPEKSFILYEVEFELKNKTSLICIFSRAYIQDIDLYNLCTKDTDYSLIVPTDQTVKLLEEWVAKKWNINGDTRSRASSSESSSSSAEETEEQALMRQMGLPGAFGETKVKKSKHNQLRNDLDRFFKSISNLGYYSGLDYSTKATKGKGKTLRLSEINQLKYKYRSEPSAKTPRYRFINQKKLNNSSILEHSEEEIEATTDSEIICHSPMSSSSSSSEVEDFNEKNGTEEASEVVYNRADLQFDFGFNPERDSDLIAFKQPFSEDAELKKYWFQRFRLFSKFNDGVLMDREGWFSVTPERVAEHIAQRMVTRKGMVILDPFTGVGGNAIQFARKGAYVYAIDLDPIKLRCARRNAEIYGVLDRITFICGDFFNVAQAFLGSRNRPKDTVPLPEENPYGIDAVFLSPPWGGPAYGSKSFDIQKSMGGLDGIKIFRLAERISPNIGYFLPRNTPSCQIIALASNFHQVEIEQSFLNGKNKAVTAYYGNLAKSHS